ncbi:hypothetical protein DPMN_110061 [Dreissena polymorpha]|uniref:Uncharacterized protein n=1 Tax=Dreissena polymorpha TaxID=45954 RepID=A0A9D4KC50_DREPO|nr:hypothetical protein DPMN_110061 [Dreissena polymorpha]
MLYGYCTRDGGIIGHVVWILHKGWWNYRSCRIEIAHGTVESQVLPYGICAWDGGIIGPAVWRLHMGRWNHRSCRIEVAQGTMEP